MQFIDFTVIDVLGASAGRRKLGITGGGICPVNTDALPEGAVNKYFHTALARASLSATAPVQYNVVTGDISMPKSSAVQDGYLSAADFASFSSGVPATRQINTTSPLAGGGNLSADLTLSIPKATAAVDGYLSAADFSAFSAKESPLSFTSPLSRLVNTVSIPAATSLVNGYLTSTDWTTFNNKVSTSRSISTSSPLTGGGDLSADRTISFSNQTANTVLAGPTSGGAAAPTFRALVAGDIPALSYAPTSRLINTTAPITGGGDLSADRTLAIPASTNSVDGYLTAADHATFSAKTSTGLLVATQRGGLFLS